MSRRYYSKRHYESLRNGPPDTAETVQQRLARRAAAEQATAETLEKFHLLTHENVTAALAWQEQRIRELEQHQTEQ